MKYHDLRDFIAQLEKIGEAQARERARLHASRNDREICDRVLRAQGPALLFENVVGHKMPVLANLFGTPRRVALGMGEENIGALREVGKLLAYLKEPEPPKGLKDAWDKWPILKQVLTMSPKVLSSAPCQEIVWEGSDVDLSKLPIQHCWPGDVAPLITWGLVVTRGRTSRGRIWGSTASKSLRRTKLSCAGWRIAAARWIFATTARRIRDSPSQSQW